MGKVASFMRLTPRQRALALECFVLAGKYRHLLLSRPFEEVSPCLGKRVQCAGATALSEAEEQYVRDVKRVVTPVCRRTPWKSECLVQALCARTLLGKRGITCSLFMGVGRGEAGSKMTAHAWTKCSDIFITGEGGHERYAVTGVFE